MARGDYQVPNSKVRFGVQDVLHVPATVLPYQAGLVTSDAAMQTFLIPDPELRQGGQTPLPVPGSVDINGTIALTFRPADLQPLLCQLQGRGDRLDLTPLTVPPGPTGAHLYTLSPDATTSQIAPLTLEFWLDDLNGGYLLYDVYLTGATFTWAENALVGASLTITGGRSSYWGIAEPQGTLNGVPVYLSGYQRPERREPNRPGSTGDAMIELLTETSPGVWDARASLGRIEVLDDVDTLATDPTLTATTPGLVDLTTVVFPDDWVSVQDDGVSRKVLSVTATTVTLTAPFPTTLAGKKLMRAWGAPAAAPVTFPVRSGASPQGAALFDDVIDTGDGLLFGENPLRTQFTTGTNAIPTGSDTLALTGTVSVTIATTAWVGVGTLFLTEVAVGSTIVDGSGNAYTVTEVLDDLNLTVQEPAVAGLAGASVGTRFAWVVPRDRPEFARIDSAESPFSEIHGDFLVGPEGFQESVEIKDLTITWTTQITGQTRVLSPWPGLPSSAVNRTVTMTATLVYDERTQDLHNRLETQKTVSVAIRTETGQPVVSPVSAGEEQYASVEAGMVLTTSGGFTVGKRQAPSGGVGQAVLPINMTMHPNDGNPDLTMTLITGNATLLVEP